MPLAIRRRSLVRILILVSVVIGIRFLVVHSTSSTASSSGSSLYGSDPSEIQKQGVLDLVTRGEKPLDARKHKFLQVRMGRDDREDLFSDLIRNGIMDYWERFEKPL